MSNPLLKNVPFEEVVELKSLIAYTDHNVSSKTIVQRKDMSMTLLAFDADEGLSTHSAAGDAMVIALEGTVKLTIGDNELVVKAGESAVMPANIPHAVKALEKFKMLLIVVKPQIEPVQLMKGL
jgi:quercetin dioxygenase-like cupin family protein